MARTRAAMTGRGSHRTGGLAVLALAVTAAVAMLAVAGGRSIANETPTGDEVIEQEIAGLLEAGLDEDDPKVAALREDLERAPGSAKATEPKELEQADRELLDGQPDYDRGRVRCDVVPPDLLTVDDIEGATCVVAPQPDGTARYVAISPDGVARVVVFGDGGPRRLEDQHAEAPGNAPIDVTDDGDIVVGQGADRAVIDLD